jgi:hypothetical protein
MRSVIAAALALAVAALVSVPGAFAEGVTPAPSGPPAPANDALANAQPIKSFPATIGGTTVGATTEAGESESTCGASGNSVWYSLRLPAAHRIAINLAASGALDATVAVFHAVRSERSSVTCERTDSTGKASLSFGATKNGLYYIRVAALQNSQLAPFTLEVFMPTPAVRPPGSPLPGAGISGQVDRTQNVNAAYSIVMHAGVSYLINLATETKGACVTGALFAPGTTSFVAEGEEGEEGGGGSSGALFHIDCGGYHLFTPRADQGGRYSFELTPNLSRKGIQRFRLQVAPAGPAETAPGLALGNYVHAHGQLNGNGVAVVRLYRIEVTSHSNLNLKLIAPGAAEFNLQLRDERGHVIECDCDSSGSTSLQRQLQPGTYYAVVSERNHTSGNYTLERETRTITATTISFTSKHASPGQGLGIDVQVTPAESGPVTVEIERFDPVFGWQFSQRVQAYASGGLATVPFAPPNPGRWRARAFYRGSRTASPSAVGYTYLQVS